MDALSSQPNARSTQGWAYSYVFTIVCAFLVLFSFGAKAAESHWDISDYKAHLSDLERSPELVVEIDRLLGNLSADAPLITRVDLLLWKLDELVALNSTVAAVELASRIYNAYQRHDYASEQNYGDTMYQIVESMAKSSELSIAYDVIQYLRESVYTEPSVYLSFIIDRCLVEMAIENYDYQRALEISQSILDSSDYMAIAQIRPLRAYLLNEITFLYNRLGNGERALFFADQALVAYERKDLSPERLIKIRAQASGNRGRAFLLLGNYEQVEKMGLEALEGGRQLKQNYLIALGHRLIGSAAYQLGDYQKALSALGAGIELADSNNIDTMRKALYLDYAQALEKVGRLEDALLWQQKYHAVTMKVQQSLSSTRARLNRVEIGALETRQRMQELRTENAAQRERATRDKEANWLLRIISLSLFVGGVFLIMLLYYMRKNQRNVVRQSELIQSANHQLEMAALHDSLTGLPNRLAVEDHLESELVAAQDSNSGLSVAHLDLDHFKAINDKYGHPAGDYMLVEVAKRMREWALPADYSVRLGGDEFLVILGADGDGQNPVERLQSLMDVLVKPVNFEGITLATSVSVGIASFPEDSASRDGLIVCSDLALFEAKNTGRGRICTFEPRLMEALNNRKALEDELIRALQKGDIFPYYQPQLDIATQNIRGVEALMRWQHPERGFIPPDEFLPVAESAGLMVELGRHAMEKAMREAAGWHKSQIHFGRIALNASAHELHEDDFVDWLLTTATRYGLPANKLSIEVVETVILNDPRRNLSGTLARLRAHGLHVELDDFGTGYASLQQVKSEDIDRLKIDRSFISDIDREAGKAVIVGSIVDMARKLEIDVVAEGAETPEELETLFELGCYTIQGYGIARPMSATAIREWFDHGVPVACAGEEIAESSEVAL